MAKANGMVRSENWKFTYDTVISLAKKIIEQGSNND